MKCTNCGKKIAKKQAFCTACGTPAPEPPAKKPFPVIVIVWILLVASIAGNCVLLVGKFLPTKYEGKGYDSPDEAITAYAKALSKGDMEKILSTFAIETYVENFSLEERIEASRFYAWYDTGVCLPNTSDYTREINRYLHISTITAQVRNGYHTLTGNATQESHMSFPPSPVLYDELEELMDQLDYPKFDKRLSSMKLGHVLIGEYFDLDQDTEKRLHENYAYLNADKLCDVAIEIEFDGKDYYLFMLTAQYDGKWYNVMPMSPLASWYGIPAYSGGIAEQ